MNISNLFLLSSLILLLCCKNIQCYNIIHISPVPSRSHKNAFDPLILELANRGHNVTVVSSFEYPKSMKNINGIFIEKSNTFAKSDFQKQMFNYVGIHPIIPAFMMREMLVPICTSYLENNKVKELIKEGKKFDIVIANYFISECVLATAPFLSDNIIVQSPSGVIPFGNMPATPQLYSHVPSLLLPYTGKMTFFQKLDNLLTNLLVNFFNNYLNIPAVQNEVSKHYSKNPSIIEVQKMVSSVLTNCDPIFTSPRPELPNVINAGGMHCRKANPLPKELDDFIQASKEDGFIYFSLGSNALSKNLPDKVKDSLLNAFSRLKQKVIWKYEEVLENVPSNVKVVKWAPQQDLLGHPKIRIFITQGGLLSMQECVYHGVPAIAMPLFGDQGGNVARIVELEIGIKVDFTNISGDSVFEAVNQILSNNKYKENMIKYSSIFRDHQQHSVQRAVSLVEYVIKHNGAWHLKNPGADLNFFQYFLLDVIAFILIICITITWVLISLGKVVGKKVFFCKKKSTQSATKKSQ